MFKLIVLLFLNATLAFASNELEGLYRVSGEHSVRGAYSGQLEVRPDEHGKLQAIRMVTYKSFQFENLNVQEVWTGIAEGTSEALNIRYDLRQADYIVRLKDLYRAPEDFKTPFVVETQYIAEKARFEDKSNAGYVEKLGVKEALPEAPLWKDERTKLLARGDEIPTWVKPFIKITTSRTGFDKDPYVLSFRDREDFKEINPYVVFDPTDFNFYQNNQNLLRVVNKVIDPISLTESMSRRNAYAYTLAEKADYYEKNMHERHIPSDVGIISSAEMNNKGLFKNYDADFSGGLWSGLYAGALAMRYLTTAEPEALDKFKEVLKGTFMLMDITGDPGEFARSIAPYDERKQNEGWIRGEGIYSHLMYLPKGNNDMIKGLTHPLMWATYVIPESDKEMWDLMKQKSLQLLKLNIFKDRIGNRPAAVGLAAIIHKDPKLEKEFRRLFKNPKVALGGYSFDTTFYMRGSADWSGINLGVVGAINEIMIARKLGANRINKQVSERLMDSWVTYESTKRALVTVASYTFAYKEGIRGPGYKKLEGNDLKWQEGMEHAKWALRGIPYSRLPLDLDFDHSMKSDWCLSPIPRLFWKGFKSPPPPPSYFYQGLYDYPIFEAAAYGTTYVWKDGAFKYKGSSNSSTEHSGADFLYLYWMSRYAGLDWH